MNFIAEVLKEHYFAYDTKSGWEKSTSSDYKKKLHIYF